MEDQRSEETTRSLLCTSLTYRPSCRWFGLVVLPNLLKFSADGVVITLFLLKSAYGSIMGKKTQTPSMLARGRAIDLSIQFILWWMPFLVLLGWWTTKPMHLLFGASLLEHRVASRPLIKLFAQTTSRLRCCSEHASL